MGKSSFINQSRDLRQWWTIIPNSRAAPRHIRTESFCDLDGECADTPDAPLMRPSAFESFPCREALQVVIAAIGQKPPAPAGLAGFGTSLSARAPRIGKGAPLFPNTSSPGLVRYILPNCFDRPALSTPSLGSFGFRRPTPMHDVGRSFHDTSRSGLEEARGLVKTWSSLGTGFLTSLI